MKAIRAVALLFQVRAVGAKVLKASNWHQKNQ
jgi:hypothetical protein